MWILNFEHLEHCFVILHLVSVPQNVKTMPFHQNITDRQTQTDTDTIHTSLSLTLSVFREHNSPSGNKWKSSTGLPLDLIREVDT